jgi:transposase
MEFVNRDFNAAINIRRCAVLESRPPALTRENFVRTTSQSGTI